ncbi:MAG: hypothetical protein WCQ32_00810 [bacterium]
MEKIVITQDPFTLSKEIIDEYGEFLLAPEYQLRSFSVGVSFTVNDLEIIGMYGPNRYLTGLEFRNQIVAKKYVPLDAYCAQAILQNEEACYELKSKWYQEFSHKDNTDLDTISFFGSMLVDCNKALQVLSFKYDNWTDFYQRPILTPFEARDPWFKDDDFALVFKEDFIKKNFE